MGRKETNVEINKRQIKLLNKDFYSKQIKEEIIKTEEDIISRPSVQDTMDLFLKKSVSIHEDGSAEEDRCGRWKVWCALRIRLFEGPVFLVAPTRKVCPPSLKIIRTLSHRLPTSVIP